MRVVLLLFIGAMATAEDLMPCWILHGIAKVETRSHYADGVLIYVDRRMGKDGERGVFQMMPETFNWIKGLYRLSISFKTLNDPKTAEALAVLYLQELRRTSSSWEEAVRRYNPGDSTYLKRVRDAGLKAMTPKN